MFEGLCLRWHLLKVKMDKEFEEDPDGEMVADPLQLELDKDSDDASLDKVAEDVQQAMSSSGALPTSPATEHARKLALERADDEEDNEQEEKQAE